MALREQRETLRSSLESLQATATSHADAIAADAAAGPTPDSLVSAQVEASVADKRREEFVGRVVKLREEVDQLNQRLDRLEK